MVVPKTSPAKSVADFIEYCKNNRGKVTFASSGTGASPHLSGELFKRMANVEMTHVPYRGGGPAINDLIPGRVDVMFATTPSARALIDSGDPRTGRNLRHAISISAGRSNYCRVRRSRI
jgi:tripartite-type tricarboxylate transporter receptor subunit TctC